MMKHWVFFLEEPSAEDFLRGYLEGRAPSDVTLHFQVFEGKQDLEKRLPLRIKHWRLPGSRFLVMRDQDSGNCETIKAKLRESCLAAGRHEAVIRIACKELEAFFVGDWEAVAKAYEKPALASHARSAKYRLPDELGSPSEELRKALSGYSKRDGARRISRHLDPVRNKSKSFHALHRTLSEWANSQ